MLNTNGYTKREIRCQKINFLLFSTQDSLMSNTPPYSFDLNEDLDLNDDLFSGQHTTFSTTGDNNDVDYGLHSEDDDEDEGSYEPQQHKIKKEGGGSDVEKVYIRSEDSGKNFNVSAYIYWE